MVMRLDLLLGVQLLYDELAPDKRDRIIKARAAMLEGLTIYGA